MWIEPDWQRRAKCNGMTAEESDKVFFISKGKRSREAKEFCQGLIDGKPCESFQSCLLFATVYNEKGIWAGTTEDERKRVNPKIVETVRQQLVDAGKLESRNIEDFIKILRPVEDSVQVVKSRSFCVRDTTTSGQLRHGMDDLRRRYDELLGTAA